MSASLVITDRDALLELIRAEIKPLADAVSRLSATPAAPLIYTTHKSGPHLPGKSRRWMLDHVEKMPGAQKAGRDWTISAVDFSKWLADEDARLARERTARRLKKAPAIPPLPPANDVDSLDAYVNVLLDEAGFRRSK